MLVSQLDSVIRSALEEDIGWGDVTTESCVLPDEKISGYFLAKEEMVVCGSAAIERTFSRLDAGVQVDLKVKDGELVSKGAVLACVQGSARAILMGERTCLNLLQRMSGIATAARRAVDAVQPNKAKITDTRKTTPGLRVLEKYAVRVGGGYNHRMGLSDGVLIKDNHIAAAGGIAEAVSRVRERIPHTLKIEVETTTLEEVRQAIEAKVDIIMLDNMSNAQMKEAVGLIAGRALTEASGNMGDKDLAEVAASGVDIISIGALTHTVRAADISLKFM